MSNGASGVPWLALGSLLAGVGTVGLVAYLCRHRGKPGANWFVAGLSTQALFCLAAGVSPFASGSASVALSALAWSAFVSTGPLFMAFALDYTGRGVLFKNAIATTILGLAGVNTLAAATAPLHGLVWRPAVDSALANTALVAPWGYLSVGYGLVAAGIGVALLVDTIHSYGPLYRREAAAVAVSTVAPTAAILAWLAGVDAVPTLAAVGVAFVPHVCLDAYAFVGTNMFESNPATRRAAERTAIDDIAAPVFVLDTGERVVEYNRAAVPLVESAGYGDDVLGTPVGAVVDTGPESATDGGEVDDSDSIVPADVPVPGGEVVTTHVDGQRREFRVARSALTDPGEDRVGTTLVFEDVTRERRREQRLDVLNRVLRHNLRNRMTTVMGHAELIEREAEDERTRELATMIDAAATDMVDAGEKAREFERLRESGPRYRSVEVEACVADAVDGYRDSADSVDVCADDGSVRTDPRWVRLVVSNLVENAVDHVEDPTLSVTAAVDDEAGELRLTVSDDGDGIPPGELAPLEEGETPLAHGTGIGRWIVEWSVRALGGEWTVDADDGTTVTVRLPEGEDARVGDGRTSPGAAANEAVAGD